MPPGGLSNIPEEPLPSGKSSAPLGTKYQLGRGSGSEDRKQRISGVVSGSGEGEEGEETDGPPAKTGLAAATGKERMGVRTERSAGGQSRRGGPGVGTREGSSHGSLMQIRGGGGGGRGAGGRVVVSGGTGEKERGGGKVPKERQLHSSSERTGGNASICCYSSLSPSPLLL